MNRLAKIGIAFLVFSFLSLSDRVWALGVFGKVQIDDWITYEEPIALNKLLRNISAGTVKGTVLASLRSRVPIIIITGFEMLVW
ncbi:hypothetical protein EBQ74_13460 [bacterium]|nr:hypothetical protein [bacterium]